MKDKALFESKEYGVGGHNKIELRIVDKEPRIWIRDGEVNAIICLDKADATALAKALTKASKKAPESITPYDFTKPIRKKKMKTTSETNGVTKKRKTRSDKGKKRVYRDTGPLPLKTDGSFEDMKQQRIEEAMQ